MVCCVRVESRIDAEQTRMEPAFTCYAPCLENLFEITATADITFFLVVKVFMQVSLVMPTLTKGSGPGFLCLSSRRTTLSIPWILSLLPASSPREGLGAPDGGRRPSRVQGRASSITRL